MKAINLNMLLPADIPPGERVLWHGHPQWISLARRSFRADLVAVYFGLMTLVNFGTTMAVSGWADAGVSAAKTFASGIVAVGLLCFLSWLSSRTTLYVVTSRRVVLKVGIALPVFFNLPFASIGSASLRKYADGTGDIALAVGSDVRIAYLHLWPHARPFHFKRPEPALKSIPDAAGVAEKLSRGLISASEARHEETIISSDDKAVRIVHRMAASKDAVAAA